MLYILLIIIGVIIYLVENTRLTKAQNEAAEVGNEHAEVLEYLFGYIANHYGTDAGVDAVCYVLKIIKGRAKDLMVEKITDVIGIKITYDSNGNLSESFRKSVRDVVLGIELGLIDENTGKKIDKE